VELDLADRTLFTAPNRQQPTVGHPVLSFYLNLHKFIDLVLQVCFPIFKYLLY
jgi:hypothetical protein